MSFCALGYSMHSARDIEIKAHDGLPGVRKSYAYALFYPRFGLEPGQQAPVLRTSWKGAVIDAAHVSRYRELCAAPGGSQSSPFTSCPVRRLEMTGTVNIHSVSLPSTLTV